MLMALIHAASGELGAGRMTDTDAEPALVATVLGAVTARPRETSNAAPPAPNIRPGEEVHDAA
jgi:hypothetical protein